MIPTEFSPHWVVIPRGMAKWVAIQSLLLGAGLALTIGSFFGSGWVWGFPVAMAIIVINVQLFIRPAEAAATKTLPDCDDKRDDAPIDV